jgi:integrase
MSASMVADEARPAERSAIPILTIVPKKDYKFIKATDSRGREIEGLWVRNGRYYMQFSVPGKHCRRVPLKDENNQRVQSVTAAVDAMLALRQKKRQGEVPLAGRAPKFDDYVKHYLSFMKNRKKPKTIAQEKSVLKHWKLFLGSIQLSNVTKQRINEYVQKRKLDGVGNRTVNYDIIALSNCLKFAKEEGWLNGKLPTEGYKRLKYVAPKRPLFTKEQFEKVCQVATQKNADGTPKYRSGELLADLIRFMRTTGARVTSALSTRWTDVDWVRRQVHLRNTKYDKQNIVVDFNNELEAVLKEMHERRLPDSDCLFPGTRTAGNVGSLRGTFETVREEAGLPNLHFHDARHHFISAGVMSGVDFMTIAKWCGHADGGMLIGKVYGHLSNEHAQRAASKVKFENGGNELKVQTAKGNAQDLSVQELLQIVQQKMEKA